MKYIIILSLIFLRSLELKQFCDSSINLSNDLLLTGVMNYYKRHYLVFRGNDVWSAQFDDSDSGPIQYDYKENFIAKRSDHQLVAGFVLSKKPNCPPTDPKCNQYDQYDQYLNTTIFFYHQIKPNRTYKYADNNIYAVFKLQPNGEFSEYKNGETNLPYNWRNSDTQYKMFPSLPGERVRGVVMDDSYGSVHLHVATSQLYTFNLTTHNMIRANRKHPVIHIEINGGFLRGTEPYFVSRNLIYNLDDEQLVAKESCMKYFCRPISTQRPKPTSVYRKTTTKTPITTTSPITTTMRTESRKTTIQETKTTSLRSVSKASTTGPEPALLNPPDKSATIIWIIFGVFLTIVIIVGCILIAFTVLAKREISRHESIRSKKQRKIDNNSTKSKSR